MTKPISATIAAIRKLPEGESVMRYSPIHGSNACELKTDDLKALADHVEKLEAAIRDVTFEASQATFACSKQYPDIMAKLQSAIDRSRTVVKEQK